MPPVNVVIPIVAKPPEPSSFAPFLASSPARNTSAVATPSGYFNLALTIKARLRGTVKRTPISPPMAAIFATSI